jgi:tRNA (guanine10-N2)-dimethyltransferase
MQARIIVGGWHPALHRLEVQTLLEAAGVESEVEHPRVLRVDSDDLDVDIVGRCSSITRWLLGGGRVDHMDTEALLDTILAAPGPAPPESDDRQQSIAVRVENIDGGGVGISHSTLILELGARLATMGWAFDLQAPDYEFVVVCVGEEQAQHPEIEQLPREAHILWGLSQPADSTSITWQERTGPMRPFFKPVGLDPRIARAMVNLAHPHMPDGRLALADPLCGTGGLLIEAALLGVHSFGSDLDEEMVEGTQRNLDWLWNEQDELAAVTTEVDDALDFTLDEPVPAFAFDPPYGRNSWQSEDGRELLLGTLARCFENATDDARLVTLLPWPAEHVAAMRAGKVVDMDEFHTYGTEWARMRELIESCGWTVLTTVPISVHGSLSRLLVMCERRS